MHSLLRGNSPLQCSPASPIITLGGPDWRAVDQIPVEREPGSGFG